MAILVDFNAMYLSSVFKCMELHHNDESSFRSFFLNSLRSVKRKFEDECGEIIICGDHHGSWRRAIFPYYKAKRIEGKSESTLDWDFIHTCMGNMYDDLTNHFAYKTIKVEKCEADDIIGVICHHKGVFLNDGSEKFVVISRDKDYKQLHCYANVQQYAPTVKAFVVEPNPEEFLQSLIIRGDGGDGVPNILSSDNCFVTRERQKMMTAKRYEHYKVPENRAAEPIVEEKYNRNKAIVDLSMVPEEYKKKIIDFYEEPKPNISRSSLLNYFMEKRLKMLSQHIQDF